MTYEAYDVVVVPFPFTDRATTKRRPALILSEAQPFNTPVGHAVLAMITSRRNEPWPLDVPIAHLAAAGLPAPSLVRMKLFTLDHLLIQRRIGHLAPADEGQARGSVRRLLGLPAEQKQPSTP